MQNFSFILFAFFASILCAFAAPVDLEKRITHTGRVCSFAFFFTSQLTGIVQGTWFEVGLGACGDWNVDSDKIIAISHLRWADGGNCNQVSRVIARFTCF